jgi:hypothetical protein
LRSLIRLTARFSPAAQESKGGRNMRVTGGSSRPFFWPEPGDSLILSWQCVTARHLSGKIAQNPTRKGPGRQAQPAGRALSSKMYHNINYKCGHLGPLAVPGERAPGHGSEPHGGSQTAAPDGPESRKSWFDRGFPGAPREILPRGTSRAESGVEEGTIYAPIGARIVSTIRKSIFQK